jgi:hypothetical protein
MLTRSSTPFSTWYIRLQSPLTPHSCAYIQNNTYAACWERFARTKLQIPNFIKMPSVGADLFHADVWIDRRSTYRRTDMTKLLVAFRNFANASQKCNIAVELVEIILFLRIVLNQGYIAWKKQWFQCIILVKDFVYYLVKFISNNRLPPELNALRNFIMLIHKLRAEDIQGYICWSWTNMDVTFFLTKFRVLAVDENGYARGPKKDIILAVRGRKWIWYFFSRRVED